MKDFESFRQEETGMSAGIVGTGSALPARVVSNQELERLVDTTDEWIRSRTGIESRHIAVEETTTSMAVEAAEKAMKNAGVTADEIDLIIVGTVSGDMHFPSTACQVQKEISAGNATAFDINAACAGFLFGLAIADAYIRSGMARTALIIGAETLSKLTDWSDRGTCVLFGDGAGAAVVQKKEEGILSIAQGSDGAGGGALTCRDRENSNPFMTQAMMNTDPDHTHMNGQEVYRFAVKTVPVIIEKALEKAQLGPEDIKFFLLHQANIRIIEAVARKLGQPAEKFPTNLQKCGNISAGSIPVLLDYVHQEGMLQKGDKIVLAGFGGGLTFGAAVLIW